MIIFVIIYVIIMMEDFNACSKFPLIGKIIFFFDNYSIWACALREGFSSLEIGFIFFCPGQRSIAGSYDKRWELFTD
jgi:hypothetical protein